MPMDGRAGRSRATINAMRGDGASIRYSSQARIGFTVGIATISLYDWIMDFQALWAMTGRFFGPPALGPESEEPSRISARDRVWSGVSRAQNKCDCPA
jgi:hypothetical protein